ncbi:lytic murein transglycosylase, partial [Patescibacteria group bacterium]
ENLKSELFAMTREGTSLQFQDAAKHAQYAYEETGVRPELIMSIVKQETNFGNNVGNGKYKTDMKKDQWDTFVKVCLELGRAPEDTPVSARPKSYQGWGGAMGIAQFIPTTWMTIKSDVEKITGRVPADPWAAQDAFLAVGVKLGKMGASTGNRDKEWEAAGRYFAGGNFKKYPWYGDNVLKRADTYKDQLEGL